MKNSKIYSYIYTLIYSWLAVLLNIYDIILRDKKLYNIKA